MPKAVCSRPVWVYNCGMKVVVLCGGQGTRLREETEFRPKPLVPVGGRPILWHILKIYARFGLKDFVLCTGYKGEMIKEYFLNYRAMNNDVTIQLGGKAPHVYHGTHEEDDMAVTVCDTGLETMTGARVSRIRAHVEADECFLLTYGDGVANVDISQLVAFHRSHGKVATVTVVHPQSRFGRIDLDANGAVTEFAEKPQSDGWSSAGYFVFSPRVFDYLSNDPGCILEQGPLQSLARDGQLMAYRHDGFFCPMDTYRETLLLNQLAETGTPPWFQFSA